MMWTRFQTVELMIEFNAKDYPDQSAALVRVSLISSHIPLVGCFCMIPDQLTRYPYYVTTSK